MPQDEAGEICLFGELARRVGRPDCATDDAGVEPLLGVVKMDVDQLGLLLAQGLGSKATSISRVAAFSRMLDMFFSGWVDSRLRHILLHEGGKPAYANVNGRQQPVANPLHNMYTVYAGGDDLLWWGPWDWAVTAARELQKDFARYTGHNQPDAVSMAWW
ncbi:MAG: hypothetical protein R2911_28345 [Caldilineaceae bacterium]